MLFWSITLQLAKGFSVSLLLFALTLVFSLPIGLIFTFGSMSKIKPLKYLSKAIVYVIRGTPLLLQLMIVVYLPGMAFEMPITRWKMFHGNTALAYFCVVLFAFVLNYACYFSEIYRGGIESINKGQYEAGQVLGMTKRQIFIKIILLQVIRRILAPISNETITLVKDTALARTVSVMEILYYSYDILITKFIVWPMFYAGVFYLVFNALLTYIFSRLERKLSYFN